MPANPTAKTAPVEFPSGDYFRQDKKKNRFFRRVFLPFGILWVALPFIAGVILWWTWWGSGREFWPVLLLLALVSLIGLGVSAWIARQVAKSWSQPLRQLVRLAERTGQGETGLHIHLGYDSELDVLARAFNRMSDRLAKQIDQIDRESAQLRAILDGMVEGVMALDADERLLFVNERAISLLELPTQTPAGRRFWELVRVRELLETVNLAVKGGQTVRREVDWPGSPQRSLTVHAAPLQSDGDAQPKGAVVVVHDNTEIKKLEQLRRDFVANVSHELKTPLSVIKLCAETLEEGALEDPAARGGFVHQIIIQAERLSFLIVDLLSLAKIESGREILRPQALDMREALENCLKRHQQQAESANLSLRVLDTHPDQWVWADEEALTQVLDNLVSNAIRYTPAGGQITLRAHSPTEESMVVVQVTDTGIGIPESDLPRIFERFFRVEKARSRDLGGTGLGLSIAKHLVNASQGTIQAQSRIGKGSTFTVRLPRVKNHDRSE